MGQAIRVAIIDNGINELLLNRKLENSMTVNESNTCIIDTEIIDEQRFPHGTSCALIFEKYCPDCQLTSIRILDGNGRGATQRIYPALEWCLKNQIRLVNLSLGTTDFRDCENLKVLVNKCAANGMIIIAATANSGFVSYPASFTNVIGVATIDSPLNYSKDYMQMGIDSIVPSEHIIRIDDKETKTLLSNSYAAPYICALIANRLKDDKIVSMKKLKQFAKEQSHVKLAEEGYEPDWVCKAYLLGRGVKSRAKKYYFETITGVYDAIQEEIDTVIAFSMSDLEELDIKNKNLIYLGNEDVHHINIQGFIWSRETRQRQIKYNHYQGNGLEVPVVIVAIEDTIDQFYLLTELKRAFANGGYHAYVIDMEPECVLYALEYMPEPVSDIDAWKNFIESQTFYKQSDLVIWCIPAEVQDKYLKVYTDCDVQIVLYNEGDHSIMEFFFEGEKIEKRISGSLDRNDVEELYDIIKSILTEEEDG
ncbi:MAG: S8 family serine peptidase [Eubacterium sp.]|nr:S8 family serine peptidase [Eubacterium sp.]